MNRRLIVVLLILLQMTTGAQVSVIRGTVVDEANAVIPGAEVMLEHLETGEKKTVFSSEVGAFSFLNVRQGKVRITVRLPGFQNWSQEVQLGHEELRLTVPLHVASASTQVEVSVASSVGIVTRSGTGGQVAARRRVANGGYREMNTESYDYIQDNPFARVTEHPRSTFAIDVDTASYANMRRFVNGGEIPPKDAVRIEELINYFKYNYAAPTVEHPVAIDTEVATPFWNPAHRLVRIGVRARDIDISTRKPANLVFLVDVSGSMQAEAKLPLVQRSLHLLVDQLRDDDTVTMVVYAGSSGLALVPTRGNQKGAIHAAIDRLEAGGSTNGGEGIRLAYRMAAENFVTGGTNRVILATDGDFNVGVTNQGELVRLIEQQAKSGVFLTVLGFGIGNYKDSTLEKLSDKGHGNYAYIDTFNEAKRVLVQQMSGTLMTVAKDVKLQVEFNPVEVQSYRLIGYENRILADEEFDDDNKQGGDMGSGHNVTAFFEVVPTGVSDSAPETRPLKYQKERKLEKSRKGELLTISLRYKLPDGRKSVLLESPVVDSSVVFSKASSDFRFAAAVAAFGMVLRDSPHKGVADLARVVEEVELSTVEEPARLEFVELVRKVSLMRRVN